MASRLDRKGDRFSVAVILAWADAYHALHGYWPGRWGKPEGAKPGETWSMIDLALRNGWCGLAGGNSLARLLVEHRGPEAVAPAAELSEEQILAWADAHHAATGRWPDDAAGAVAGAPGETWRGIRAALRSGSRGLAGRTTLACLLDRHRGVPKARGLRLLTVEQIYVWADAHHAVTGRWPTRRSGRVIAAPGETWRKIDTALNRGLRGLPGGASVPQILRDRGSVDRPRLTVALIVSWARAHRKATGAWPSYTTGPVAGVPGELWYNINRALHCGDRGLAGGTSLRKVLRQPYKNPWKVRRKRRARTVPQHRHRPGPGAAPADSTSG